MIDRYKIESENICDESICFIEGVIRIITSSSYPSYPSCPYYPCPSCPSYLYPYPSCPSCPYPYPSYLSFVSSAPSCHASWPPWDAELPHETPYQPSAMTCRQRVWKRTYRRSEKH